MTVAEIAEQMDAVSTDDRAEPSSEAAPDEIEAALEDGAAAIEPEPTSISERLKQPLEGSIYDREIGELWNPEQGAENRLLLVAEEIGGLEGIPRIVHVLIGFAELAEKHGDGSSESSSDDRDDEDDEPADEIDDTTREVLNYDPE